MARSRRPAWLSDLDDPPRPPMTGRDASGDVWLHPTPHRCNAPLWPGGIIFRAYGSPLSGQRPGIAAAACTQVQVGEIAPFDIAGYCLGTPISGAGVMKAGACSGIDGAIYLFPGLVFGVVFGPLLHWRRRLSRSGAVLYALVAAVANAVAVMLCVSALHPVDDLLPFDNLILDLAAAGIIAGAGGGALLSMFLAALDRGNVDRLAIAVAAALGALTPLVIVFDYLGVYAFYMIWQGGYAAAVAISVRVGPNQGLRARVTEWLKRSSGRHAAEGSEN
jgi:hypothetical protein